MLDKSAKAALDDCDQLAHIRASFTGDEQLIQKTCDWLGVEKEVYQRVCKKQLLFWDKCQSIMDKTY